MLMQLIHIQMAKPKSMTLIQVCQKKNPTCPGTKTTTLSQAL